MKQVMFRRIFQFFISIFCGISSGFSQASDDSLNILFIGNSFTHMNNMPRIFDKIATAKGKKVFVRKSAHSGYSFQQHFHRKAMHTAIKREKWDYVILQGFSREFIHEFEHIDTATVPYLVKIIDTIKTYNPCANILFYMTWGYKDGYQEMESTDTYAKMTDSIQRGYRYVSSIFDIPVAPIGKVWEQVRTTHPALNLYAPDAAHPNKNGSYLIAATFYASIFNESPEGVFTNTIGAEEAKVIQHAAKEYVLSNQKMYKLDKNRMYVKHEVLDNGTFLANFSAFFPTATSLIWSFGDGKKSQKAIAQHHYEKAGKYLVDLEVTDTCGTRCFTQEIELTEEDGATKMKSKTPN